MTLSSLVLRAAMLAALSGCAPAVDAPAAAPVTPLGAAQSPAPVDVEKPASSPLEASLQVGMPYAALRAKLLGAGWQPLRDPQCWSNVGGEARVCDLLPETESCSTDGHCLMRFANSDSSPAGEVRVDAYGPYTQWNVEGRSAEFAVKSWNFTHAAPSPAVACPSKDFDSFLKAFASQDAVRAAFTRPYVRVAELQSDDTGDHARDVLIARKSYEGFDLTHRDGAFHYVNHAGTVDPAPLKVEVAADGEQARLVRFNYGLSEGNSYRFVDTGECWQLAADPEPPTP